MSCAVLAAMLAYIDDLHRSADLSDTFADDVASIARGLPADLHEEDARAGMLALARRHRVDAIKARAKIEAVTEQFVRRFGLDRFEQERSKRPARPRRPI